MRVAEKCSSSRVTSASASSVSSACAIRRGTEPGGIDEGSGDGAALVADYETTDYAGPLADTSPLDPRLDLWAVGVTLFQCLCG